MPFKSNKQRRYMHANLPRIAKRWERDYANGGSARVGLANGSIGNKTHAETFLDLYQNSPTTKDYNINVNADLANRISEGLGSVPYVGGALSTAADVAMPAAAFIGSPFYDAIQGTYRGIKDPDKSVWQAIKDENIGSTMWERMVGASAPLSERLSNLNFGSSAQAGEPDKNNYNYSQEFADLYKQGKYDNLSLAMQDADRYNRGETTNYEKIIGKNPITDIYDRDYTAGEHYNMTPDARTKAMQTQGPDHMRRQTNFPTNKQTAPRSLGFDTSYGVANEADVAQKPLTQEKGNIFQRGWQGAKDFKTSIGEGITGILDNTMLGKFAAMNDATNRRAFNYNPALQGQIDYLKGSGNYGVMDASGLNKITGGVLAGKNLQSLFGSNDLGKMYDKSIARTQKTIKNFDKQWSRLKKDDPDEYYKKLAFHENKLKQKEREKKLAGIAASKDLEKRKAASKANWQQDYSTWTSPSGRDHAATAGIGSKESKQGPAGGSIGASRFLARGGRASYFNGGLASLWPR